MREKIRRGLGMVLAAALLASTFTAGGQVSAAALSAETGREESVEDFSEKDPAVTEERAEESEQDSAEKETEETTQESVETAAEESREEAAEESREEAAEESREEAAEESGEEGSGEPSKAGFDEPLEGTWEETEGLRAPVVPGKSRAARAAALSTLPVGSETRTSNSYACLEIEGQAPLYYSGYGLGVLAAFGDAEGKTATITVLQGTLNLNGDDGHCVVIDDPNTHITLKMENGVSLSGNQESVGVITVNQGTLVVESGTIRNNHMSSGYGIRVNSGGRAEIRGGKIGIGWNQNQYNSNCSIYVDGGEVVMTGGEIDTDGSQYACGVYVTGGGRAVITGNPENRIKIHGLYGVRVSGENSHVELSGCEIRASYSNLPDRIGRGLWAENQGIITVSDSSIREGQYGISADSGGSVVVTDCSINISNANAYGAFVKDDGMVRILGSMVSVGRMGVYVSERGQAVIENSPVTADVSSDGRGVYAAGGEVTIIDSPLTGKLYGICVQNGSVDVSGSATKVTGTDSASGIGISVIQGQATLHEGTFSGGKYALSMYASDDSKIGDLLAENLSFFKDGQRVSDTGVKNLTGTVTVGVCKHEGAFRYEDNQNGTHNSICLVCGQPAGEAKPHEYDADGRCALCGAQAAAAVLTEDGGEIYYESFREAWEAALGKTARIRLFVNVDLGTEVLRPVGPEESRITLEIPEGKHLTGTAAAEGAAIIELPRGSLTIRGGLIGGAVSVTGGDLTLESGLVDGAVSVTGGRFIACGGEIRGRIVIAGDGRAYVEGIADIETNADEAILVSGNGQLVMTGGKAAGRVCGIRVDGGSAKVTGGEVSRMTASGEGILVEGGTLTVANHAHIIGYNHGIGVNGGEVRISGGVIEGDNSAVDNSASTGLVMNGGRVTVSGGSFRGKAGSGAGAGYGVLAWKGSFTAEGGSFEGTGKSGYGIFTYGNVSTIKGGRFTGSTHGMFLADGASAVLTGGIFRGSGENGQGIGFLSEKGRVGSLPAESYAYREVSLDGENVTKGNWITEPERLEAKSLAGSVMVEAIPVNLTGQPEDAEVPYGYTKEEAPILSVTAEKVGEAEEEIAYQWYRVSETAGDEKIEGADRADWQVPVGLTIPEGSVAGTYHYYCEISCDGYVRKSEPAVVTVKQAQGKIEGLALAGWIYGEYDGGVPSYTCNSNGRVMIEYKRESEPETAWSTEIPLAAGDYLVRVRAEETVFYTQAEERAAFTIAKAEPSLAEIVYQGPAGNVICNGEPREAEAFPAAGVTGLGSITFRYRRAGEESFLEIPPVDIGSYEVLADVEEGANYLGRSGLLLGEFRIVPYETDAEAQASEGWTRSAVITAPEGFAVSDSAGGSFGKQFFYERETGPEGSRVAYYLKEDKTGYRTAEKMVLVKVDRSAPSFAGADGGIWISGKKSGRPELLTGLDYELYEPGPVEIRADDRLSGLGQVFYYIDRNPGESALTGRELDELGPDSWTELTEASFELTENGSYVIYAWATDKVGNRSGYICSGGIVIDDGTSEVTARTVIEKGIRDIPEELKKIGFDTEEKILAAMSRVILNEAGYSDGNMEIYDVELQFSLDGGKTWIRATKENFPPEGLTVTIPYPQGTNRTDYEFIVTHMFTQEMNGYRPGEIEKPEVFRTADGIRFTVKGLSPITVAWKKAAAEPEGPGEDPKPGTPEDPGEDPKPGTPGQTRPDVSQKPGGKGPAASAVQSPQTGDERLIWPWIVLLTFAVGGMAAVFRRICRAGSRSGGRKARR